jgi:hypothetical protein
LPDTIYWKPRIALFGNLGLNNGKSIPSLIKNSNKGRYDVIFHLGISHKVVNTKEELDIT